MRFSTVLLAAAVPALAAAIPLSTRDNDKHYDDSHKSKDSWATELGGKVFDFTSTYVAYATPDQVINNNQTAVPGEEGASGVCESTRLTAAHAMLRLTRCTSSFQSNTASWLAKR